ncbi:helix-turn-helix transcriptional regulator [Nocardioides eburneiflavus]|uniref:Helix-turn-helix transcriptional regulator n=1 Tax=Nocardioides eburneiflavus TaxID=2518372 RepID=A0A4Z1C516_9ACTN|nr:LuxR C-terminal-related transcriptional regulator [Nocardioides eburneiflavus]TGN65364.1 helix-turn-helix transcriptional regulator [Nocardioides eburneiflavus]
MATPVLATKLHAPALRERVVARARLTEALDTLVQPGQRLGLVSAPAGFGKTTLVSGWTAAVDQDPQRSIAVAWLSLDEADNDLNRWTAHLFAALERADMPIDSAVRVAGTGAIDVAAATGLLTALVNHIAHAVEVAAVEVTHRWLVVLDDYHVINSPDVHATVTYLLDHAPEQLRVLITTRSDPPLPLARLRSRAQLTELRANDLRFTAQEASDFLNEVMGLDLPPEDVEALDDRTEGWAAGLQLAGLSLRGRASRGDVSAFIEAFTGSNRFVVDYLADEVLAQQPAEVRDFLLRTSVLDRLTGSLCAAVTGQPDSGALLERLDRDNLFVVPLDDDRAWYRYHHLFADVLRARLLAGDPDAVNQLHRDASDWYAAHGSHEDAIRHAFAANDFNRAGRLVEAALFQTRQQRRDALLLTWMRALPEDVVRPNPVLSMCAGWAAMVAGDLQAVERHLDDADRALVAAAENPAVATAWVDTEDLRSAPAGVHMYRAALAQARGDSEGTAEHARAALTLAGPEHHFIRAGGAGFLGLAAWARGDIAEALPTFEQCIAELRAAGNHVDALDATIVLAGMWVTAGRPSQARAVCEQALVTATAHGEPYPRATADLHTWLADLALGRNDLAEAEDELGTAAALAERASITENQHRWPTVAAGLRAARGDYGQALQLLDDAARLYRAGFYPDLRPLAATKARVHLARGRLEAALAWVATSGVGLDDHPEFAREYAHLTLARVHLALHRTHQTRTPNAPTPGARNVDLDGVLALLDRLEAAATADARHGSALEVRLLQALTLHALGGEASAAKKLASAVAAVPEVDAFARLFLDEGDALVALLEQAPRLARSADADVLTSLRRRVLAQDAAGQDPERPATERRGSSAVPYVLADPLSEREVEVLRLLASELTGPEIARHLFISLNTLRTHTRRIYTKLDATNRAAAVRRGRELDLL